MIFGIRSIIENIESGNSISKVFINKNINSELLKELFKLLKSNNIPISKVPKEKLNKITQKNHQGVIAYVSPVHFVKLSNVIQSCFEQGRNPKILILDNITDSRNLGAIIRTACCSNIDALVIPLTNSAPINADTMKTSAGALAHISICREKNLVNTIKYLKNSGLEIIGLSEKSKSNIYDFNFKKPIAIILGSEEKGISKENLNLCDIILKIPITGPISSLNVSSAAAIVCYEILKHQ
ncbi:MAG: 23S rRNA (guanosine(2251)-2'-O)-methyltransferase RlmB [Bacteroidetes bacterium]|nr:23S rRNA (guanosine(2251)-2'-O)-methyltransferase RlmB [Bacteroidota bacterium]